MRRNDTQFIQQLSIHKLYSTNVRRNIRRLKLEHHFRLFIEMGNNRSNITAYYIRVDIFTER